MHSFNRVVLLGALLSASCALPAQQPAVVHAQLSTQSAEHGLEGQLDLLKQGKAPVWAAYSIPVAGGFHTGSNSERVTYLEGEDHGYHRGSYGSDESYDHATLLLRVAGGAVEKVRVESPGRSLDAGGLRFVWLTGVTPGDSVRALEALARGRKDGSRQVQESAIFLISLHEAPEATLALVRLAGPGNELAVREKAAFWLVNQRGHEGLVAVERFAREDGDAQFREKLTFDLTLSKDPAALEELIRMAHGDASPQVRRQAQFWMAQAGGKKVAGDLRAQAEHDPDGEVRKSAVFALSRLPGDEAATQLIQVAQTSKDAGVRKQAVFWLGQSSDPRALEYLTRLLQQ